MSFVNDTSANTIGFLLSLLIPGSQIEPVDSLLEAAAVPELRQLLRRIEGLDPASATAEVKNFEQEHPVHFGAFYDALLVAHYSTGATQERVRELADRGPREASVNFDSTLLDRVIETQAGKGRL